METKRIVWNRGGKKNKTKIQIKKNIGCTCVSGVFVALLVYSGGRRGGETLILLIESRVHGTNLFPLRRRRAPLQHRAGEMGFHGQ